MTSPVQIFTRRIRRFAATRRRVANATRGGAALTRAAVIGIAGLLLLSGWIANAFVNAGLFLIGGCAWLAILVRFLWQIERRRTDLREALGMETLAGGLNSRLISALDFLGRPRQTELTQAVIDRAGEDLNVHFEGLLDRRPLRRNLTRGAVVLAVFLGLGCTPWFHFARIAATWQESWFAVHELIFPTRYTLTPPAGPAVIRKLGDAVPVSIRFSRKGYSAVTLTDQVSDKDVTRTNLTVDAALTAGTQLPGNVESQHRLRFEFGKRRSEEVTVIFTRLPALVNMQTEMIYPTYTRLLPKDLEGIQDRLTGLPGTKITIGFTFSKDLDWATLTWDNGEKVPLDVVGRFASASLIHKRPGRATLDVGDVHGFALERPHAIQFELLDDELPRLFVPGNLKPNMPQLADVLKTFGFGVRAEDDYGMTRVVLKWSKATLENRDEVLEKGEIERLITPPRQKVTVEFQKAFENVSVRPGDLIAFQLVAYDNREPNRQQASSATFSFFIHQTELGDMSLLGDPSFGAAAGMRGRFGKTKRDTGLSEPMPLKTREQVRNEFDAAVVGHARLPALRSDNSKTVQNYFQALAPAKFDEKEE
jgi:hypothetical protein